MKDRLCRARPGAPVVALLACTLLLLTGCQTLREVANLRDVNFEIDRVAEARLAGVDLETVRSYEDLGAADMIRLSAAIADREVPLSFTLHLNARNPESNTVAARLTEMDWTLLLQDTETISGRFAQEVVIPPGEVKDVPIPVEVELTRFFDDNLRQLVELALAISGDGEPRNVKLKARPTIQTQLGPIQYPRDITIVNEDVGRES